MYFNVLNMAIYLLQLNVALSQNPSGRGGPGRLCKKGITGRLKMNHHTPVKKMLTLRPYMVSSLYKNTTKNRVIIRQIVPPRKPQYIPFMLMSSCKSLCRKKKKKNTEDKHKKNNKNDR